MNKSDDNTCDVQFVVMKGTLSFLLSCKLARLLLISGDLMGDLWGACKLLVHHARYVRQRRDAALAR